MRRRLIFAAVVLFILGASAWLVLHDDPPPDDSDLLPPLPSTGPFEESMLAEIIEIAAALPLPPDWSGDAKRLAPDADLDPWPAHRLGDRPWRDPRLLEWMRAYFEGEAAVLDRVEGAVARAEPGAVPDSSRGGRKTAADARETVCEQLAQRALWHRARGDLRSASRDLGLGLLLAERLAAEGTITTFSSHSTSGHLWSAIILVESILHDGDLEPEVEARIIARPAALDRAGDVARRILQGDYLFWSDGIDRIAANGWFVSRNRGPAWLPTLLFKPHRTKARLGDLYRSLIREAERPPAERRSLEEFALAYDDVWLRVVQHMNWGELFLTGTWMQPMALIDTIDRLRLGENALRLLLALRRYERLRGELPADLDALLAVVPELGALPVDPYSGAPFRYDPGRRLFWSVGQDLRDDGGVDPEAARGSLDLRAAEPTWRIVPAPGR